MDIYGIGTAIHSMVTVYQKTAKRSGRSNLLLSILRDDDCVIFTNKIEADRVAKLAKEKGIAIKICINSVDDLSLLYHKLQRIDFTGKLLFDHSWLEDYYKYSIVAAEKQLKIMMEHLSRQCSATIHKSEIQLTVREGSSGHEW